MCVAVFPPVFSFTQVLVHRADSCRTPLWSPALSVLYFPSFNQLLINETISYFILCIWKYRECICRKKLCGGNLSKAFWKSRCASPLTQALLLAHWLLPTVVIARWVLTLQKPYWFLVFPFYLYEHWFLVFVFFFLIMVNTNFPAINSKLCSSQFVWSLLWLFWNGGIPFITFWFIDAEVDTGDSVAARWL